MDLLLKMFTSSGAWGWVVLVVIISIIVLTGLRIFVLRPRNTIDKSLPVADNYEQASRQIVDKKAEDTKVILNTGNIKCICFRNIKGVNVADFTTIPEPIGEMYQFDPSCPVSGVGYIVREVNGKVEDYDPREVEYKVETSPEMAWFAISWDIVKDVYFTAVQWWKSTSVWLAGILLVIVFISTLVVLGD